MRWYRDSIVGKLMVPISLLLLVGFGLLAILNGVWLYDQGLEAISEEGREAALRASADINSHFQKYGATLQALAQSDDVRAFANEAIYRSPSAYHGNEKYSAFLSTLTRVMQQDQDILNIYFGSEHAQTFFDPEEWEAPGEYRVSERDWYREGKRADSLYFTDPYIDAVTGRPILSITYPIYVDASFKGLLSMDLLLDTVNSLASSVRTVEGGYTFVMDRKGRILVHPDAQVVLKTNGTDLEGDLGMISRDMVAGKSGYGEAIYQGESQLVFYNPVGLAGWSLGVVVPKKAFTQPVVRRVMLSVIMSLVVVFCVALFASAIAKRSLAPLGHLTGLTERMAIGDLTVTVESDGTDEIGHLAVSFGRMVESLREMVGNLKECSDQVADTSQELSTSSEEVGASIEEVAASANEFAGMATEMSSNVQSMASSADHVAETARVGNQAVATAIDETSRLQEHMTDLAGRVQDLGASSQEIQRIVEMISDIADQTNLLALNAAIEAARAGEFGRGFAVVAEEVRKLAEQSSKATSEIELLIGRIQKDIETTVTGMHDSQTQVEHTFSVVNASGKRLQEILRETDGLVKELREISGGTEQMSSGSEEIAAATEEQSAAVQQVASASQDLSNIAQELQKMVDEFQVG